MGRLHPAIVITFLLVLLPVAPVAAQVEIPACSADPAVLSVSRDAATEEVLLDWTTVDCPFDARRSLDPSFPPGSTDILAGPLPDPPQPVLRDAAPPPGLVFYRLAEHDPDWGVWEACRRSSEGLTTSPMTLAYHDGTGIGWLAGFTPGDVEATHFVPTAPIMIEEIRMVFGGSPGPVQIHVWGDYGRSWPDERIDLIPPFQANVPVGVPVTFDVSDFGLVIHPRDHFWIGYVHLAETPYLYVDAGSSPGHSRFKDPDRVNAPFVWAGFQDNNQYLVEVRGQTFCRVDRPAFADVSTDVGFDQRPGAKIAWGDADGDGWDDLLLNGTTLLRNDQAGGFADVTAASGLDAFEGIDFGVWGDLDNDGDQDLFLAVDTPQDPPPQAGDPQDTVALNDGNGVFTRVDPAGVEEWDTTAGASFGDFDADGFLDLYVGNWLLDYPNPPAMKDHLYRGNGDGTFTDITDAAGLGDQGPDNRACYGVAPADYDGDGDLDIFVGNYGYQHNFLWENQHAQGSDTFVEVGDLVGVARDDVAFEGGNTFGEDWGDFDNDGDLDLMMMEIAHPRYQPWSDPSSLQVNQGAPDFLFQDERAARGIHYDEGGLEANWVDFDNDGDLDLMLTYLYPLHYARLYRQEDDGTFVDYTYEAGILVHDSTNQAWADYDRDGDLDLAISNRGGGSHLHLYENLEGTDNAWLRLRLEGAGCTTPGECNCGAVGARVWVTADGVTRLRDVKSGKGHRNSQPSLPVEFGLGDATTIDEVRVRWPCGREVSYTGAAVDGSFLLRETETAAVPE